MTTCLLAASPVDPQLRGTRATGLPSRCRPSAHQLCMLGQPAAAYTLTLHALLKQPKAEHLFSALLTKMQFRMLQWHMSMPVISIHVTALDYQNRM